MNKTASDGSDTRDKEKSVWAAEHGASSDEAGATEGANAGHRWRIHGRLEDLEDDVDETPVTATASGTPPEDAIRARIARETEIDARDVSIEVVGGTVTLAGTVVDDGERRELEAFIARIPGIYSVRNRLRTQVV
jgi:osmotically-inducible protein OsmY